MMRLCADRDCTGCAACVNVCAVDAITMVGNEEGFLHPYIDEKRCVKCGKCQTVCPQLREHKQAVEEKIVFAGWLKNKRLLRKSTSGGAFTALAEAILSQGGCVFGAGFDKKLTVIHKRVDARSQLKQLRGSKYVQSNVGLTFREVKQCLISGKKVLYSGTACQIDGLYTYLGKRYEGMLFTIDLVCHGVPSPKIWRDYLDFMEEKHSARVREAYFRNKEPGWYVFGMKIVFDDGKVYKADTYEDPYIRGFLRELYLRPSCHQCRYANVNRVADFTLADFWGYHETCRADRDHDTGISMIMINTANGKALFKQVKTPMHLFERPLQQAVCGNQALSKCFAPSEKREAFWNDYQTMNFAQITDKYLYPEPQSTRYIPNVKKRHKQEDLYALRLLPNKIILKLLGAKGYQRLKRILRRER